MSRRKYLVTGGSGFIGAALVRRLTDAGHAVRVLDDNSRGAMRRLDDVLQHIEFLEADVRDAGAVREAASGMDSIIHLAYVNGTERFYKEPERIARRRHPRHARRARRVPQRERARVGVDVEL